jgi:hypothetical protein
VWMPRHQEPMKDVAQLRKAPVSRKQAVIRGYPRFGNDTHFFVATVSVIGALQLFDQAIIAGGPGGQPNNALTTIVLFLYRSAIAEFDFGFAAAVGIVLFVIIFTVTLVQRRLFGQAPSW